jgi:hypothetical protein
MTSISYFARLPGETNTPDLCRKKASDCQRTALTTEDPRARRVYLQLAKRGVKKPMCWKWASRQAQAVS